MKIAFLGKGGSGKSTLAATAVRHYRAQGFTVLAIDADHNMDLAFSLGIDSPTKTLGSDPSLIKTYAGLNRESTYADTLTQAQSQGVLFSMEPADSYTDAMTHEIEPGLRLMVAGQHTDEVRSGLSCSHSLAAPLKVYVPLLKLGENQAVVVDERAGTDPVATGILSGIHRAYIVAEPTPQSVRVACQIAAELEIQNVPYEFIANKVREDLALFAALPKSPLAHIGFSAEIHTDQLSNIL